MSLNILPCETLQCGLLACLLACSLACLLSCLLACWPVVALFWSVVRQSTMSGFDIFDNLAVSSTKLLCRLVGHFNLRFSWSSNLNQGFCLVAHAPLSFNIFDTQLYTNLSQGHQTPYRQGRPIAFCLPAPWLQPLSLPRHGDKVAMTAIKTSK